MTRPSKEDSTYFEVLQGSFQEGVDPIRALLQRTIQEILEEELTIFLNAEPYSRTEKRRGYLNRYKPRALMTRVGRLEIMVPKDREGRFQMELFEKYQRSEKALFLAIAESVPIRPTAFRGHPAPSCGVGLACPVVRGIEVLPVPAGANGQPVMKLRRGSDRGHDTRPVLKNLRTRTQSKRLDFDPPVS